MNKLYKILAECTVQVRKGDVVKVDDSGPFKIITVDAMPAEEDLQPGLVLVDCHFLKVAVNKAKAEENRAAFIAEIETLPADRLASGPSYIEVGGWVGDQGVAFEVFAMGQVLGLWKVITPEALGATGQIADKMAGDGFVMITGYHPERLTHEASGA